MRDYAIENGAEIRYDTMLVKCEQDESGRVTGVICRDGNDLHYIRVNASRRHSRNGRLCNEHRNG